MRMTTEMASVHGVGTLNHPNDQAYEVAAHHCAKKAAEAYAICDASLWYRWDELAERYRKTWRMKQWQPKRSPPER